MNIKALARNTLIGFVVLAIVYFICYNWLDVPLMYFIYTASMDTILMPISHLLSIIFAPECWMLAGLIAVVYASFQYKKGKLKFSDGEKLMRFGLTVIATGILVMILKVIFGRDRPDMLLTQGLYGFNFFTMGQDYASTPSGHATLAFCGFFTIARLFKKAWLTPLLMLCAIAISLAKLALADHYLSDILFGAYLGIICSLWMELILNHVKAAWCPSGKTL